MIQEPTYARPNNTASTWTATDRTYVLGPLPDERLIWMEGRGADRQVSYPHTDRRGSTIALSREGQAVTTYAYDEYGRGRAQDGVTGYPFRYTGQRLDPYTGTYHYKAREYAPQLGRFLQADPARFVDGPNIYAYVGNNPWTGTDPTGMWQQGGGRRGGGNPARGPDPHGAEVARWNRRGQEELGEGFTPYSIFSRGTGSAARREDATAARDNFGQQQARWAERSGVTLPPGAPGWRYLDPPAGARPFYPPNRGFERGSFLWQLEPGERIIRYGPPTGRFAGPEGSPFGSLALPSAQRDAGFNTYEVLRPVWVRQGEVRPWFGQEGGGTQYMFGRPIHELLRGPDPYLRQIPP